jgi:hypothetical protein
VGSEAHAIFFPRDLHLEWGKPCCGIGPIFPFSSDFPVMNGRKTNMGKPLQVSKRKDVLKIRKP